MRAVICNKLHTQLAQGYETHTHTWGFKHTDTPHTPHSGAVRSIPLGHGSVCLTFKCRSTILIKFPPGNFLSCFGSVCACVHCSTGLSTRTHTHTHSQPWRALSFDSCKILPPLWPQPTSITLHFWPLKARLAAVAEIP